MSVLLLATVPLALGIAGLAWYGNTTDTHPRRHARHPRDGDAMSEQIIATALIALMCAAGAALVISLAIAEVRAHRWVRQPDPDPWIRRRID